MTVDAHTLKFDRAVIRVGDRYVQLGPRPSRNGGVYLTPSKSEAYVCCERAAHFIRRNLLEAGHKEVFVEDAR